MSILEISGAVVTVVFIIYFLVVRNEVVENNDLIRSLRSDINSYKRDLSMEVLKAIEKQVVRWSADGEYTATELENNLRRIFADAIRNDVGLDSEKFIDEVVARINRKQV